MRMTRYANPQSGVRSYRIAAGAILVRFADGAVYRYDETAPGLAHVERMKELARAGRGLATYISQHVGSDYAAKFDPGEAP